MKKTYLSVAGATVGLAVALGGAIALTGLAGPVCAATTEWSFKEDVLPIFKGRCVECHQSGGAGTEKSGLDLTSYEGVMKGTEFGPMIVPGDPDSSNLMRLLDWRASIELRMPHGKKKLSTCDRDAIRGWIRQGAQDN
jgi:mono/diheme cytochrome c family protein